MRELPSLGDDEGKDTATVITAKTDTPTRTPGAFRTLARHLRRFPPFTKQGKRVGVLILTQKRPDAERERLKWLKVW